MKIRYKTSGYKNGIQLGLLHTAASHGLDHRCCYLYKLYIADSSPIPRDFDI